MAVPRRKQICLDLTPYYHCISRCVRQAFLCGSDKSSGRNFDHRRKWIEDLLLRLSGAYCIDTAGYAIMSNHYHLLLHVDRVLAESISDEEVLERWCKIHCCPPVLRLWVEGADLSDVELDECVQLLAQFRDNLSNLSRFMGDLNEKIARWANKEDDCKGRFWEGRFDCQAILDREALLQTLCYVDLNPIRAGMANTPETSTYTSAHRRLNVDNTGLFPFIKRDAEDLANVQKAIPIFFNEYLDLLDWTGREIKADKRGAIPVDLPAIAGRIGLSTETWLTKMRPRVSWFPRAVGSKANIEAYAQAINQRWLWRLPDSVP